VNNANFGAGQKYGVGCHEHHPFMAVAVAEMRKKQWIVEGPSFCHNLSIQFLISFRLRKRARIHRLSAWMIQASWLLEVKNNCINHINTLHEPAIEVHRAFRHHLVPNIKQDKMHGCPKNKTRQASYLSGCI
jgi:hypothetical protein